MWKQTSSSDSPAGYTGMTSAREAKADVVSADHKLSMKSTSLFHDVHSVESNALKREHLPTGAHPPFLAQDS